MRKYDIGDIVIQTRWCVYSFKDKKVIPTAADLGDLLNENFGRVVSVYVDEFERANYITYEVLWDHGGTGFMYEEELEFPIPPKSLGSFM